jgi:hypothetical protein
LAVINIGELGNPAQLGHVRPLGGGRPGRIALGGSFVYQARGGAGMEILDVRDPTAPVAAEGGSFTAESVSDLQLVGDHIFAVGGQQLSILDVTDWVADVASPATPTVVGSLDAWSFGPTDIDVVGTLAHIVVSLTGVQVADVSDPTAPAQPGGGDGGLYSDITDGRDVAAGDGVAFVSRGSNGLLILDTSTPETPVEITTLTNLGGSPSELELVGDRLYVIVSGALVVLDVSTPGAPVELGRVDAAHNFGNLRITGDRAVVGADPLVELDIADPANMQVLGGYVPPSSSTTAIARDGLIYMDDFNAGLEILRLDRPTLVGDHFSVAADAQISYQLQWPEGAADLEVACEVSGGSCEVTDVDRDANIATVTWTTPASAGDYMLRATLGHWISFGNAFARIRVE